MTRVHLLCRHSDSNKLPAGTAEVLADKRSGICTPNVRLRNEDWKALATEAPATTSWATKDVRRARLDGTRETNDRSAGAGDIDDVRAATVCPPYW